MERGRGQWREMEENVTDPTEGGGEWRKRPNILAGWWREILDTGTGHARTTPAPPQAKKNPTARVTPAPCPRHARASVLFPQGSSLAQSAAHLFYSFLRGDARVSFAVRRRRSTDLYADRVQHSGKHLFILHPNPCLPVAKQGMVCPLCPAPAPAPRAECPFGSRQREVR
eukprot:gene15793-biopygen8196